MLTKANSAAKKVKRAVEETSTNAAMGAAAARRGSLENLQTDWVLAKARAAGVPIGGGGSEPEPEAPLQTAVGRHHLGEHAERFPRLDGYLEKQQKGAGHLWQRRWFVLDGCVLRYYKSSKDAERNAEHLGLVWSHDILSVRAIDAADHERMFLLEVFRAEKPEKPRVYSLRAATNELVSRWVESLDRSRRLVKEIEVSKDALLAAASETAGDTSTGAAAPRLGASEQAGYLFKQNPRGIWQKRWCVLCNSQLLYKATKTSEQSNTIDLQTCRGIQKDSANKAAFNVDTGDRVFKFMADSDADADEWVDLLHRSWLLAGGDSTGAGRQDCELVQQWEQGMETVQANIKATFAQFFGTAEAEDVTSTLGAAEMVLLEIIGVHTQLAAAGHFERQDIAEYHTLAYHRLLHSRLSQTTSVLPDSGAWDQRDALRFMVWCSEYHTRLCEITSLELSEPSKLTELSIVPRLEETFMPRLETYAQKRSPKGGGKLQVWQKRWFVLQHCRLTYYKSQNDDEPLGSILLSQVASVKMKHELELKLIVAGRKTVVRFETSDDASFWMQKLEHCRQIAAMVESFRYGNAAIVSKVAAQYDRAAPGLLCSEIDTEFLDLEAEEGDVNATLHAAESITDRLTVLLDDVATCQPPREDIAQFYVEQYHRRLYEVICSFLTASALEAMEAKDILLLVGWVYNYHDRLRKLGGQLPPEVHMTAIPAFQQVLQHVPKMSGALRKLSPRAKRGKGIKGWQKRHFILENCILKYYKTEPTTSDELPQGEIRMDQLTSLTLADSHGSLGMKLTIAGRVYYLMAESEPDLQKWVDAIERSTLRGIVQALDYEESPAAVQGDASGDEATSTPQLVRKKRELASPEAVSEAFETIFEPRHGYAEEVEEDLGRATSVVLQLVSVVDAFVFEHVDEAVVDELATRCHQCVVRRIEAYLAAISPEAYEQGITHSVLSWMRIYHDELEQQAGSLTPALFELECVQPLCEHYRVSMLETMTKWCKNLIKLERESVEQIEHSDEEGLHTGGPVDLFTMVNQQIAAAHSTGVDQLTFSVLLACEGVFGFYVAEISKQVTTGWQTMPLEFLCAVVNNCSKMMEHATELSEEAESLLNETQLSSLAPDGVAQGFLDVAKITITSIVDKMMADLSPLFAKVFSDAWFKDQDGMGTVIATTGDILCDLQLWLQEYFFKRLVTQVLDRIAYCYIEALLITHKVKVSAKVKQGIAEDLEVVAELADPDSGFIREASLRKRIQVVDDVRELMVVGEPNLVKKFSDRYTAILQVHPDASIVMDHIVKLRTDLNKKQRQSVLDQCKKCRAPEGASATEGMFAQMKSDNAAAFEKGGGNGVGKALGKGLRTKSKAR